LGEKEISHVLEDDAAVDVREAMRQRHEAMRQQRGR
jgi:hypothetical protein